MTDIDRRLDELVKAAREVIAAEDAFNAAWATCPYDDETNPNPIRRTAIEAASVQGVEAEKALRAALAALDGGGGK